MQSFTDVPPSAMASIPASIPSGMLYRCRKIMGCRREQAVMIPTSGQGSVRGGQKIIFQLPSNSLVDLSTLELNFLGVCDHGGNDNTVGGVSSLYVKASFFPRNIQSIISYVDIKIGGRTIQRIDNYHMIYNILSDYCTGRDATSKNRVGANADPSNKHYDVSGGVLRKAGYPIGNIAYQQSYGDYGYYTVRQWLGFLGNASTKIIHTGMLGEVVVEIGLEDGANILMESLLPNRTGVDISGFQFTAANSEIGVAVVPLNTAGNVVATGNSYTLSNVEIRITKYTMPVSFYDAIANVLASGSSYEIWFPNYISTLGQGTTTKTGTTRISVASNSLDMVIGTFLLPNRTIGPPLLGNTGAASQALISELEQGSYKFTFENQLMNGSSVLLNNSKFFCRNGSGVISAKWNVGGVEFRSETYQQMYNGILRAFGNSSQDVLGGLYPGIASTAHFRSQFFAHILQFTANTDNDVYTVSGVDSIANSIDIIWDVTGGDLTASVETLIMPDQTATNTTCTPLLIACTNSHFEVGANRNLTLWP